MKNKTLKNNDIEIQETKEYEVPQSFCKEVCCTLPLVCKSLKLKMQDHLLLGGEHDVKISPQCNSPQQIKDDPPMSSDEKKEIVLQDPKFGMFSLFKYHLKYGYKNVEMKRTNRFYCSHVFSLTFALPILILIAQVMLYLSLVLSEARDFDGNICPNKSVFEHKLMICGISLIYFVRSFFIWDNMTERIGLKKMNRADNVCAILDTFHEFSLTILVYSANIWIVFVDGDVQNMILNSLAMEFLMMMDNEFEELYFQYMPGAADDIYDNIFVTYHKNKELIKKREKENCRFKYCTYLFYIPYKLLVLTTFLFPLFCLFMVFVGPICK